MTKLNLIQYDVQIIIKYNVLTKETIIILVINNIECRQHVLLKPPIIYEIKNILHNIIEESIYYDLKDADLLLFFMSFLSKLK